MFDRSFSVATFYAMLCIIRTIAVTDLWRRKKNMDVLILNTAITACYILIRKNIKTPVAKGGSNWVEISRMVSVWRISLAEWPWLVYNAADITAKPTVFLIYSRFFTLQLTREVTQKSYLHLLWILCLWLVFYHTYSWFTKLTTRWSFVQNR